MRKATLLIAIFFNCFLTSLSFSYFHLIQRERRMSTSLDAKSNSQIGIAHVGNSIQYYNDCPRLLEHMLRTRYDSVFQDSCLRGGATLSSLLVKGNGMARKFGSPTAKRPDGTFDIGSPTVRDLLSSGRVDVVVVNDHTQWPVREDSKRESIEVLKKSYLPLFAEAGSPEVILLMTAAYRKEAKGSGDLGTYDEFTAKLKEGYTEYQGLIPNSKIAPVGLAFQRAKQELPSNDEGRFSWETLYAIDDFHPSPHGTLLEAFVLYITIVGAAPPKYDSKWWATARYFQPSDEQPLPLPTNEEASILWKLACQVCGVDVDGGSGILSEL
eukprot:Nitzschia sp. Nitz4//scaffold76_size158648//6831//7808//NITZ4_002526-RA/size158648-processed-gene-0.157-mRNA-1//1//CDS//3329557785//6365//frame0